MLSVYTELDPTRHEIRLLQISAKRSIDPKEEIGCKLTVHSLDDKPSYTAISYVWGDPQVTLPIRVNGGHEVPATINLVEALVRQREEGVHTLWVDALCINQADDTEKAQQIQMMGNIYRQASQVVAWLGQPDGTTERALQVICEIYDLVVKLEVETLRKPNLVVWARAEIQDHGDQFLRSLCATSTIKRDDLGLVVSFLQRPFWTRLWVIQELSLASVARLWCGRFSIDWQICEAVIIALTLVCRPVKRQTNPCWPRFEDLCLPFDAKSPAWMKTAAAHVSGILRATDEKTMSMLDVLEYTCNNTDLEVLDPRDRIYALHGLLSEEDRRAIPVDLSTSYKELYLRTTRYMLAQHGPSIFEYSGLASHKYSSSLPSWAIDWRSTAHRDRWWTSATKLETPYSFDVAPPDGLKLKATRIGQIVTIVPFSGQLKDALVAVDVLERSSALHDATGDPVRRRAHVWQAMIPGFHFKASDARQLDIFVRQCSEKDDTKDDARTSPQEPDVPDDQSLNNHCRRALQNIRASNLLVTDGGHIANTRAHVETCIGDALCAFPGDVFPFVLRREVDKDGHARWSLVGRALVMGFVRLKPELRTTPWNMDKLWETSPSIDEILLV